jgi:hypothetical protein
VGDTSTPYPPLTSRRELGSFFPNPRPIKAETGPPNWNEIPGLRERGCASYCAEAGAFWKAGVSSSALEGVPRSEKFSAKRHFCPDRFHSRKGGAAGSELFVVAMGSTTNSMRQCSCRH